MSGMSGMVEPDADGLIVARRWAQWHLGDPSWANRILSAYLNPDVVQAQLEHDMADDNYGRGY